jgi:hypothetical protein
VRVGRDAIRGAGRGLIVGRVGAEGVGMWAHVQQSMGTACPVLDLVSVDHRLAS